jgi:serine/threonine protein kinase
VARTTSPLAETEAPETLGRYRLIGPLGQGGMGAIHLAMMSGTGEFRKLVVIKELRRDLASQPNFVELFLGEAKLAGRLTHPNIVQTLEAGQDGDRYYLAMEFLDGQPFSKIIQSSRIAPVIPMRFRLQVICDALAGLHYAHELCDYNGRPLNIVHCDVSPSNVFVTYDGHVKIVDFGIASASGLSQQIEPAVFKGKLRYAAPEQLLGKGFDRRADIFSAGVMLWEAISLQKFTESGAMDQAALERRLTGAEPRVGQVVPQVPLALQAICDKALSLDPNDRFATADEFREELLQYIVTLGPAYTPRSISHLVTQKFEAERAMQHQMIHEGTMARQSGTMASRRLTPEVAEEEVHEAETAIADLSELVESIRIPIATVRPPAPQAKRSQWVWAASAGLVVALATGWLAVGRGNSPQPTPAALQAGTDPVAKQAKVGEAPGAALVPAPFQPEPSTEASGQVEARKEAADEAEGDEPEADERAETSGKTVRRRRKVASRTTTDTMRIQEEARAALAERTPATEVPSTPTQAATSRINKAGLEPGKDLRTPQKGDLRELDSNPFAK